MSITRQNLSVIIVSYRSDHVIENCITSIDSEIEIVVVDNNSNDGSSEKLQLIQDENFRYFRFNENIGSSRANNYGIKKSNGEFIYILNADVFLAPNCIELLYNATKVDRKIGTFTGKLLSDKDNSKIDTTGIVIYKEGVCAERGIGELDNGQYDQDEYIAGACCAAALYRKEMLEDIKYEEEYFDEDMFAFVEDADLSMLSMLLGWKTYFVADAIGYHVRGGSTSDVSDFVQFLSVRNSELSYRKLLRSNVSFKCHHSILYLLRYITVDKKLRIKINTDISLLSQKFREKHDFFENRLYFEYMKPFISQSYVLKRLKDIILPKVINR